MSEQIYSGIQGEYLCKKLMSEYCGRRFPLFMLNQLGESHQTIDYFVRLVDEAGSMTEFFFFVQVKATRLGYNAKGQLRVHVSNNDMQRLVAFPAPTYVVGIDLLKEVGFILSANVGSPASISTLSTKYPLECGNLKLLWREVKDFWDSHGAKPIGSAFI